METLYREVKTSERLPDSLKVVTVYYDDNTWVTQAFYDEDKKSWHYVFEPDGEDTCNEPESWLEPLPPQEPVITDREIVMHWWNSLSTDGKMMWTGQYFSGRSHKLLTGSEIEKMFTSREAEGVSDEDIQYHIKTNCRYNNNEPMMDEQTFYEGAKWMREQSHPQPQEQWISVDDRLPEVDEWILCGHTDHDWTDFAEINQDGKGKVVFWNRECEIFPTYWMPLPPPPKAEG